MITSYWMKLYTEILDDPKMGTLPDHLWRRCIEIFLLAKREAAEGKLPLPDDIAWALRTTRDDIDECLKALADRGIVHEQDNEWHVTNFIKRQGPSPVQERVERYRTAQKDVTNRYKDCNENVTVREQCNAPETETEKSTETEEEQSAEQTPSLTAQPVDVGQGFTTYQEPQEPLPTKDDNAVHEMFVALSALCRYDVRTASPTQMSRMNNAVTTLLNSARASPSDLTRFGDYWKAQDWRGKKGDAPEPAQVTDEWGRFRSWQANPNGNSKPKARFL